MRISDWSSDVCSSDLRLEGREFDSKLGSRSRTHLIQKTTASLCARGRGRIRIGDQCEQYVDRITSCVVVPSVITDCNKAFSRLSHVNFLSFIKVEQALVQRSEEHTSEFQSLMRISYAVFCLKKKKKKETT